MQHYNYSKNKNQSIIIKQIPFLKNTSKKQIPFLRSYRDYGKVTVILNMYLVKKKIKLTFPATGAACKSISPETINTLTTKSSTVSLQIYR